MRHRNNYRTFSANPYPNSIKPTATQFHPLSYYVKGNLDISGDHLAVAVALYDDESDVDAGCDFDALCDPRTSYMDIMEFARNEAEGRVRNNGSVIRSKSKKDKAASSSDSAPKSE